MTYNDSAYIKRFFSVYSQEEKDKVRGHAFYPSDYLSALVPDDVAHIHVIRSPHAGAKFTRIDAEEARKLEGVIKIITHEDVPSNLSFGSQKRQGQKILSEGSVKFRGEPVALVVAESRELARAAASLVKVDWEAAEMLSDQKLETVEVKRGSQIADSELEFAESNFRFPSLHARYLEPESGWVSLEGDKLTFRIGSLLSESQRLWLSKILEVPLTTITAQEAYLGGMFAGRQQREIIAYLGLASWLSKRSCSLSFNYGDQDIGSYGYAGKIRIGYDPKAGRMRKISGEVSIDAGSYLGSATTFLKKTLEHAVSIYEFEQVELKGNVFETSTHPRRALKGEGMTAVTWVTEQLVDQVAKKLDVPPLDFRVAHGRGTETSIHRVMQEMERVERPFRLLTIDRNRPLWDSKTIEGRGFAFQSYQTSRFDKFGEIEVAVEFLPAGSFLIRTSNMTLDLHVKNALAEVAARVLKTHPKAFTVVGEMRLEFEKARKRETNPEFYYLAQATWSAAQALREKLIEAGKKHLKSEDVDVSEGAILERGSQKKMGFRELAFSHGTGDLSARYVLKAAPDPHGASAGAVSRISFHPLTGELQVNSVKVVVDAGPVIYRTGLEVELEAAVAWVMAALFSSTVERDQPIPTPLDEPEDVSLFTIDYPQQDFSERAPEFFGSRAVADVMMSVVMASLVNAIQDAKGMSLKQIPVVPEVMYPEVPSAKVHTLPFRKF